MALRNPIFGNGIGTSREANANFAGNDQPSHNLYIEVWEELGVFGLIIYICFIISIFKSIMESAKSFQNNSVSSSYLLYISNGLQACLFMTFLFSFASYGLSLDIWYLLAGLSVVQKKLAGI